MSAAGTAVTGRDRYHQGKNTILIVVCPTLLNTVCVNF